MCGICGCQDGDVVHEHEHEHEHEHGAHEHGAHEHGAHEHVGADGRRFTHAHGGGHQQAHPVGGNRITISLEQKVLAKNDAIAETNRRWFGDREILALNFVSSPGSGKTTLLCRTITDLRATRSIYVIEGDQETSRDADRIREAGAPAVQLNTGTGCHLEADMVARGIDQLKPGVGGLLLIENVGNLVCPAMFDLGERAKVAILSVTEGDDKPLKYPHMFRAASLLLLNKIDLLAHVDFDVDAAIANAKQVNPSIAVLCLSARTGEGLAAWYDWIARATTDVRARALA